MKIVPMILAAIITAFIMNGLNSLAHNHLDDRAEPTIRHINDRKILESRGPSGLNDVVYDKYCMDGLVMISTKMTNLYYRKPDNSLVTCEEYNEYMVTDI